MYVPTKSMFSEVGADPEQEQHQARRKHEPYDSHRQEECSEQGIFRSGLFHTRILTAT
jgi:hypothetical protein